MNQVAAEEKTIVPELRFSEFSASWCEQRLEDIADVERGKFTPRPRNDPKYYNGSIPFAQTGDIAKAAFHLNEFSQTLNELGASVSRVFPENTILMTIAANIGDIAILRFPVACPDSLVGILAKANQSYTWLYHDLSKRKNELLSYATTNAQANINLEVLRPLKINVPELEEQEKIASFLTAVDEKLNQLRRKRDCLQTYKRGVMQKILSQDIRFTTENGTDFPDWEEREMNELFDRVVRKNNENNKNVLTISAQQGLINQEKYFNKSVSAQDVTGYYLLEKNEFAYNKSYSKGYPMGAIKRLNNYDKGVVSTLYICFKAKPLADIEYFENYFDSGLINKELHKIAQEGARNHGLLNVSVVEFFNDIRVKVPSIQDQKAIAKFLNSLNTKLELANKKVEEIEAFKKGLLQKMFV